MDFITFVGVYLFIFFPGLVNDIKLVKNMLVLDEIFLSLSLCCLCCLAPAYFMAQPLAAIIYLIIGLQAAGLERFFVGYIFHNASGKIEIWHEDYHDQLRRRRTTKEYIITDHFLELLAYAIVFSTYYILLTVFNIKTDMACFFWLGVILEHYLGLKLRLRVQYAALDDFSHTIFDRFFRNATAFYWYHIMIDTRQCMGFSSPWFDTQFNSNPFKSKWTFSSPLPFVDFFFVNYDEELDKIKKAFEDYNKDPIKFLDSMKESINYYHENKPCLKCAIYKKLKPF